MRESARRRLIRAALAGVDSRVTLVSLRGDEFVQWVPFGCLQPWIDADLADEPFHVARRILGRLDDISPVVLVIEDLHWVDLASRRALAIAASRLHMGFLGLGGDWNDKISSVWMVGTQVTVLREHVQFGGSTLTLMDPFPGKPGWGGPVHNLVNAGWNDRASSIKTW